MPFINGRRISRLAASDRPLSAGRPGGGARSPVAISAQSDPDVVAGESKPTGGASAAATTKAKPKAAAGRQPPPEHRFKPGQSGNPAGRPKGSKNRVTRGRFARILLEEADRASPAQKGLTAHRAALRGLLAAAADGDLDALKFYLSLANEAEAAVADLDAAEEVREAAAALAERQCQEAAEEEALARRLAAEDPDLYNLARQFTPVGMLHTSQRRFCFSEAVAMARTHLALELDPKEKYDMFLVEAALAAEESDATSGGEGSED